MSLGTLVITYPDHREEMVHLTNSTTRIGRVNDNDVVLSDPSVSRYHAELHCDGNTCQIVDLSSANGTWLGNTRLTPQAPQPILSGMELQLGHVRLRFSSAAPNIARRATDDGSSGLQRERASPPFQASAQPRPTTPQVRVSDPEPTQLVVEAGSVGIVTVRLVNTGTVVDFYTIQVDGWNDAWLEVTPARLKLLPGTPGQSTPETQGQITLAFRPPRVSEAYAQQGSVTIMVISEEQGAVVHTTNLPLTIRKFRDYSLEAQPVHGVTRRKSAKYSLALHNRGNGDETFILNARDDKNQLQFTFEPAIIKLGPGQSTQATLRAYAMRRPWSGPPQMYNVQISAVPVDEQQRAAPGSTPNQAQGMAHVQLAQNARLPAWAIPMVVVATMLLCGGIAFAGVFFGIIRPDQLAARGEQAALAATTLAQQQGAAATSAALQQQQLELQRQLQQSTSEEQQRQVMTTLAQNVQQQTAIAQTTQALNATQTVIAATQTAQAGATQTAAAQPTDTPTRTITPVVSPTPTRGTVSNGFITTPPEINGVVQDTEWSAQQQIPGFPTDIGTLSFMNDNTMLYLLVDLNSDTGNDSGSGDSLDGLLLAFDVTGDQQPTPNQDRLYGANSLGIIGVKSFPTTSEAFQRSNAQVGVDFGSSPDSSTPHRIWELAIPLEEIEARPGEPVHVGMQIISPQPSIRREVPEGFLGDFSKLLSFSLGQ